MIRRSFEQRPHIAGNAYDHYDQDGLLIHKYGPHIFHTNAKRVFDYFPQFTKWRPYEHRVRASVDGQIAPIPINLPITDAAGDLVYVDGVGLATAVLLAQARALIREDMSGNRGGSTWLASSAGSAASSAATRGSTP